MYLFMVLCIYPFQVCSLNRDHQVVFETRGVSVLINSDLIILEVLLLYRNIGPIAFYKIGFTWKTSMQPLDHRVPSQPFLCGYAHHAAHLLHAHFRPLSAQVLFEAKPQKKTMIHSHYLVGIYQVRVNYVMLSYGIYSPVFRISRPLNLPLGQGKYI